MTETAELRPVLEALVKRCGWETLLDTLSLIAWQDEPRQWYGDRLAERIDDALAVVETVEAAQ